MVILFILRHSPYGSNLAREALDMALACAAFDQKVQLLFIHDGVFQLLQDQRSAGFKIKNIAKSLVALELYDITDVFVDSHSLQLRGIENHALAGKSQTVDAVQIQQLVNAADKVIGF